MRPGEQFVEHCTCRDRGTCAVCVVADMNAAWGVAMCEVLGLDVPWTIDENGYLVCEHGRDFNVCDAGECPRIRAAIHAAEE